MCNFLRKNLAGKHSPSIWQSKLYCAWFLTTLSFSHLKKVPWFKAFHIFKDLPMIYKYEFKYPWPFFILQARWHMVMSCPPFSAECTLNLQTWFLKNVCIMHIIYLRMYKSKQKTDWDGFNLFRIWWCWMKILASVPASQCNLTQVKPIRAVIPFDFNRWRT